MKTRYSDVLFTLVFLAGGIVCAQDVSGLKATQWTAAFRTSDIENAGTSAGIVLHMHFKGDTQKVIRLYSDPKFDYNERGFWSVYDFSTETALPVELIAAGLSHSNTGRKPGWHVAHAKLIAWTSMGGLLLIDDQPNKWVAADQPTGLLIPLKIASPVRGVNSNGRPSLPVFRSAEGEPFPPEDPIRQPSPPPSSPVPDVSAATNLTNAYSKLQLEISALLDSSGEEDAKHCKAILTRCRELSAKIDEELVTLKSAANLLQDNVTKLDSRLSDIGDPQIKDQVTTRKNKLMSQRDSKLSEINSWNARQKELSETKKKVEQLCDILESINN